MKKDEDEDLRVKKLIGEITKLLPERSKIKTDLFYFKYAPILVMLFRWYGISQFYDNKMEIKLWYEENEEPVLVLLFHHLYPIPDFPLERSGIAPIVRGVAHPDTLYRRG